MRHLLLFLAVYLFLTSQGLSQEDSFIRVDQNDNRLCVYVVESNGQLHKKPILDIHLKDWLRFYDYTLKVKERYGFFKRKYKHRKQTQIQTVDSILYDSSSFTIRGRLSDQNTYTSQATWRNDCLDLIVKSHPRQYQSIHLTLQREKDNHFYGAGQQHSFVRLNGKRFNMLVQEQGIGAGDQPVSWIANTQMAGGTPTHSYAPIPYFSDEHDRGTLLMNTEPARLNFKRPSQIQIQVDAPTLVLKLIQGKNGYDLIEKLTAITGRPRPLPDWVWGNILGVQGGHTIVDSLVKTMQADQIPIDAIWIQDWVGRNTTFVGDQLQWNWIADTNRYPAIQSYNRSAADRSISMLGYINPMFITTGSLFKEGDSLGYFVKDHWGETYIIEMTGFDVGLVDLTHPKARIWMKKIIQNNLIANGFNGWMADFGEALPFDAVLFNGQSAEAFHNRYPVEWAKLNKEAIEEVGKEKQIAFFSRSGYTEGAKFSSFYWIGDQMTSWQRHDGLPSITRALLSSGLSGMPINHADIGGFAGFYRLGGLTKMVRSTKLLKRHIELSCLSPVFRTHEGILPDRNAQVYDDDIRAFYKKFAQIRSTKKNYIKQVAEEAYTKGYPMVRHLSLVFPTDQATWFIEDQFLLGDSLLIAPILTKRKKRPVYLPEGSWRHLLSGKTYSGSSWYRIKAPLGTPCYFERLQN